MRRGFLTGAIRDRESLAENDSRRGHPRFAEGNLEHNLHLVESVEAVAADADATPAQVALAWVLAQGNDIVAIPGTTKRSHLEQNLVVAGLDLSDQQLAALHDAAAAHVVAGERYPEPAMRSLER